MYEQRRLTEQIVQLATRLLALQLKPHQEVKSYDFNITDAQFDAYLERITEKLQPSQTEGNEVGNILPGFKEDIMPKKLGGSVRQKGNTWEGRISVDGKMQYVFAATEAECITELNKIFKQKIISEKKKKRSKYYLHTWLDEWLKTYKQPIVSNYTYYLYERIVKNHLKALPDKELDDYTNLELQKFINRYKDTRQRTGETVKHMIVSAFRQAVNNGLCRRSPAEGLKLKKHRRETGQPLTHAEERQLLIDVEPLIYRDYFLTCLYSGARRSEALRLTVSDIDWTNNRLHIPGTKTQTSDRDIPIFDKLAAVLRRVVPTPDGRLFPFKGDAVTKYFNQVCPQHKLHDLRTTFISRCYEAGIPIKLVSDWAGHKTSEVTINHYLKVSAEMEAKYTAVLNNHTPVHTPVLPPENNARGQKRSKKRKRGKKKEQ